MIEGFKALVVLSVLKLGSAGIPGITYPAHAECRIQWRIPNVQCQDVQQRLVNQINDWQSEQCPGEIT